jgi:ATP-dependent exoDNAse (exonuclease V) beta subunit
LSQTNIPFQVKPQVENLEFNYRSGKTIVEFNNNLFLTLSALFEGQGFKRIYGIGSQQKSQLEGGYVRIEALPKGGLKEENMELYVVKTLEAVDRAMELKFKANEIAVLVRKRDQASAIGSGLTQAGYSILSSDSLVVGQSKKVQVVLAILKLTIQPNDSVLHKLILDALWELSPDSNIEYHKYIQTYVLLSTTSFFKELEKEFLFNFSFKKSAKSSVLEATEYIMEQFVFLLPPNDPFLNTFLEDVFEFYSTRSQTISAYLKYWERQEEKLRIITPAGMDAIHLMTIHQAKGLEFPVVILPFMDTPIHPNLKEKLWYPFKEEPLSEIQWGWITASKEIQLYGDTGQSLYDQHVLSQKQDAVNVLYVATTRAKEQLYIITQEISSEGTSTYSHLFNNFVKQQGKQLDATKPFELGISLNKKEVEKKKNIGFESRKFEVNYVVSSHWKKRLVAHKTLNVEVKTAQIKGLLIHEILAKIYHTEMLDQVLEETFERNEKAKEYQLFITKKVKEVITHPMLSNYFERDQQVLCEQDVLVPKGPTLRPDRVNLLSDGGAIIIDYKTGVPKEADGRQIDAYEKIYQDLGYSPIEKFLVYINDEVLVEKRKI